MSKIQSYDIPCPECKIPSNHNIFHSINTSFDNAVFKILNDEINFVECPHCFNRFQVKTGLLFNNMIRMYAVYYNPRSFESMEQEEQGLKKMLGNNFYLSNSSKFYDWELFKDHIRLKEGIERILEDNKINMEINPQELEGHWNEGWALDLHTISSTPVGVDEHGHTRFETVRPPIAEELFKLKYRGEKNRIEAIAKPASAFLKKHKSKWELDVIIPIPPSDNNRTFQPVYELAKAIGTKVNLPVDFKVLKKTKPTSQLKQIDDPEQRKEILKDAFDIATNSLNGKDVLIFDDLYRSGETLNAVCDILLKKGKARGVYVLTITKTRSKR
jgi:predicted amidophosphoribosyltransferase